VLGHAGDILAINVENMRHSNIYSTLPPKRGTFRA
jgi:hypothetical protein